MLVGKNMVRLRLLLLLCSLFPAFGTVAQVSEAKPWLIGAGVQGGFIISHTQHMEHLAVSHPTGFELNGQKQTTGTKYWHQLYKYPKVGYAFTYFDYHNPVLGKSVAASTYINKTMLRSAKSELNFRLGLGLAYFTNGYDLQTNSKNTVASSAFNATLHTRFDYQYQVARHYSVFLGLGLNHYSNGATKKPNLGINIPTLTLGMNYHTASRWETTTQTLPDLKKKLIYNLSTTAGWRQIGASNPEKFVVQSVTFAVLKPLNLKSNLVLGAEGFYDRSLKVQQLTDTTLTSKPFPDTKKAGAYLGHELLFGNLSFQTQVGYYVYRPYKQGTAYYERLALKYHFTPAVFGGLDLKIHGFAADVLEWRVGYKF
jgi:hypothetical protein